MILNNADNIMLGAVEVNKIMCGSAKVWERSTPDTYRELEYIKSTGTQYIITDFILSYNDKVVLDTKFSYEVRATDTTRRMHRNIFGYWGAGQSLGYQTVFVDNDTTEASDYDILTFYIGFPWSEDLGSSNRIFDANVTTRQLLIAQRPTSSWGSAQCTVDHAITMQPPASGCPIFACQNKNLDPTIDVFARRDMYLYSFKVYDSNNTLTHDLVPAERERDGATGLYDRVTGKFYGNAGTGEFEKSLYTLNTYIGVWSVDSDGYPYVYHDDWADAHRLYTQMTNISSGQTIVVNNPMITGKIVQIWFFTLDSEGKRVLHTPEPVSLPYTFTSDTNTKFFMSIKYQDESEMAPFDISIYVSV